MVWIDGANLIQAKARSNKQVIPIVQFEVDDKRLSVLINKHNYDDYRWMVRADMDANLRQKLIDAFLALDKNNALDNEILSLQNTSKFIATSD
jgi:phosphonate transport system substrate-binding protein